MKHLVTSLLVVAFFSARGNAQTTNALSAVQFADANTVFAAGLNGTVLRSNDAGATWTNQASGASSDVYALSFVDASTGVLVGGNSLSSTQFITHTVNGGGSWSPQSTGTGSVLGGVSFVDANTGWAVGHTGKIFRTTDGGATWEAQSSGVTNNLNGVKFVSTSIGFVVGDGGKILKTTNGGTNWVSQSSGTTAFLFGASFVSPSIGTVVGNAGKILRTTNGGESWVSQSSGTTVNLIAVCFVDANIGFVTGWYGIVRRTTNGGGTWTALSSGTMSDLYGVSFKDANTGVAVGLNGTIIRTANGGATWGPASPLPVQLASFRAVPVNSSTVRLDWMTLTEVNNYGFEVQKSPNDENNYLTIPGSFIPGHGTTTEPHSYSFQDFSASPGRWFYRLKQIDLDGTIHYSDGVRVDVLTTVADAKKPEQFFLHQNYPNPFNPETHIACELASNSFVTLKVYNILGKEVATLVSEQLSAGTHVFDVSIDRSNLASGTYLYRLTAGDFVQTRRMVVLK